VRANGRSPWLGVAAAAILAIFYLCLYPWRFDWDHAIRPIPWQPLVTRIDWLDAILNLFFYVPLGWAGTRAAPRGQRTPAGAAWVAFSGLLSLSVEILQQFTIAGRSSSLRDVACNGLGALLGAVLAAVTPPIRSSKSIVGSWPAVTLLAFWCIWQGSPFFPYFRLSKLRQSLVPLHGAADIPVLAEYLAAGLILPWIAGIAIPRRRWMATAICAAFLLGRLFWSGQVLPLAAVLGFTAGLAASLAIRNPPVYLLLSYLLYRQLAPFTFSAAASGFGWIPFEWLVTGDRDSAVRILASKLFWYGALIWQLTQSGVRWAVSSFAVIAILLVTEWIQRWLPGRTPELTDPALAAIAAAIQRAQSGRNPRA
jgi:VanZ family protein